MRPQRLPPVVSSIIPRRSFSDFCPTHSTCAPPSKLDVLTGLKTVKVCVAYKIGDRILPDGYMPASLEQLEQVVPVYEEFLGWEQDISKVSDRGTSASEWMQALPSARLVVSPSSGKDVVVQAQSSHASHSLLLSLHQPRFLILA